jgi:hypothetical protein
MKAIQSTLDYYISDFQSILVVYQTYKQDQTYDTPGHDTLEILNMSIKGEKLKENVFDALEEEVREYITNTECL